MSEMFPQFEFVPPTPKSNTTIRIWLATRNKLRFLAATLDLPMTELLDSLCDQVLTQFDLMDPTKEIERSPEALSVQDVYRKKGD